MADDDAQQIKLVVVGDGMCNHNIFHPKPTNSNLCVIISLYRCYWKVSAIYYDNCDNIMYRMYIYIGHAY